MDVGRNHKKSIPVTMPFLSATPIQSCRQCFSLVAKVLHHPWSDCGGHAPLPLNAIELARSQDTAQRGWPWSLPSNSKLPLRDSKVLL